MHDQTYATKMTYRIGFLEANSTMYPRKHSRCSRPVLITKPSQANHEVAVRQRLRYEVSLLVERFSLSGIVTLCREGSVPTAHR